MNKVCHAPYQAQPTVKNGYRVTEALSTIHKGTIVICLLGSEGAGGRTGWRVSTCLDS